MNPEKKEQLYAGKAKSLFNTNDKDQVIAVFRDDTTAFDGEKCAKLEKKGEINNQISAHLMKILSEEGIPTHFVQLLSPTEALLKRLKMIPVENVIRNVAAGSLTRRLGIEQGTPLSPPVFELFYKNDALHDPMINEGHAISFGWATQEQLNQMCTLTFKINEVLQRVFHKADLILVDAKFEFGVGSDGHVYLGDEISPDSCRIWDKKTGESLDKDRFRKDLGRVIESYQQIAEALGIIVNA